MVSDNIFIKKPMTAVIGLHMILFFEATVGFQHLFADLIKEDLHFLTECRGHHIELLLFLAALDKGDRIDTAEGRVYLEVKRTLITNLKKRGDHGVKIDIAPIRIEVQVAAGCAYAAVVVVYVQALESGAKLRKLRILIKIAEVCVACIPAYAEERMVDAVEQLVQIVRG